MFNWKAAAATPAASGEKTEEKSGDKEEKEETDDDSKVHLYLFVSIVCFLWYSKTCLKLTLI